MCIGLVHALEQGVQVAPARARCPPGRTVAVVLLDVLEQHDIALVEHLIDGAAPGSWGNVTRK